MARLSFSSPTTKKIIGIITFSFLVTFIIARLTVYLVLGHWVPNMFLTIRGVHIHHFTYGLVILSLVGLFLLLKRPNPEGRPFFWTVVAYGVGLGLTVDEFGMWIRLDDEYWVRQSYDAVIIIAVLLLNVAYFQSIRHLFTVKFWNWIRGR